MDNQNYYEILGVDRKAGLKQIKKAYKILAKRYHPDTCQNLDKQEAKEYFRQIQEAYDVLSKIEDREEYDQSIKDNNSSIITPNTDYNAVKQVIFSRRNRLSSYDTEEIEDNFIVTKKHNYAPKRSNEWAYKVQIIVWITIGVIILIAVICLGVVLDRVK